MIQFTNENFDEKVLQAKGVILVDFWATWCGPCQLLGPIIEDIADEFASNTDITIGKLDVDENGEIAQKYGIMSIPALKFFKDGNVVAEFVGVQPKEVIIAKLKELVEM